MHRGDDKESLRGRAGSDGLPAADGAPAADRSSLGQDFVLPDPAATDAFGAALAEALPRDESLVVTLEGELGAGKTALVRAVLRALGHGGPVKSPSYALVELYKVSRMCLYHLDFYRFSEPSEFQDAGLAEVFHERALFFVEWPRNAHGLLPAADLAITIEYRPDEEGGGRRLGVRACSARGATCLRRLNFPFP
jgi:tRNA threonylcarbamoyladenosine biosynthesis protein TsaE